MDIDTLKIFVSLAELGSLTAAAEAHNLTQPAVSIRLRKLEEELYSKLYYRIGRGVKLTAEGEAVLASARRIVRESEDIAKELAEGRGIPSGRISIGTIDAASSYVLPPVFSRFRNLFPRVEIRLEVTATASLVRFLRSGEIDLAVATLPIENDEDLRVYPIYREKMILIVPPSDKFFTGRKLSLDEISKTAFISFHEGAVTRRVIEQELARHGIVPHVTITTDSPEAIKNLVSAGLGWAVLPQRVVEQDIARGSLRAPKIRKLNFERTLGLVLISRRYLPVASRAFVAVLSEMLRVHVPPEIVGDFARAESTESSAGKRHGKHRISGRRLHG